MKLIIKTPDTRAPERNYILSVLLGDFLGLDWQRVPSDRTDISITLQGHSGEIRMPDILLQTRDQDWLTPKSLPSQPLTVWDIGKLALPISLTDSKLPIIYGEQNFGPCPVAPGPSFSTLVHYTHRLPIDVFGSAFFMLTRYEEVVKPDLDEHGRFPAWASLAYQENFLERPIVDEYLEILWAAMNSLWPGLDRKKHEYKLILTHDVDWPFGAKGEPWKRVIRRFGGDFLVRRNPLIAACRMGAILLPGPAGERLDPNNTFNWIMDQSERIGVQSEFYFMAGKTSNYDSGYDIYAPRIQRLLARIHKRGHIIGLHPSYSTLGSPNHLEKEAINLRIAMEKAGVTQLLRNGRQHYLRWKADQSWLDWEKAGLEIDSSVGFSQYVGFRAGTCRCFTVWSLSESKKINLTEKPLIFMEGTLLSGKYMNNLLTNVEKKVDELATAVKNIKGNMVVLWHNSMLSTADSRYLYKRIINKII